MKAKIDRSGCIGCGLCAEICPAVFRMSEDGLAEAYDETTMDSEDSAREAMESCPVSVISIEKHPKME